MPAGLAIAFLSGLSPLLFGMPFMTALWYPTPAPVVGMIGTPLFFDIGVFLVVTGATLTIIFTISETT